MRGLLAGLLLFLGACASSGPSPERPLLFTLSVKNETATSVRVRTELGRQWTVSRDVGCVEVRQGDVPPSGFITLFFRPLSEAEFSADIMTRDSPGWFIRISPWDGTRQFDAITLRPAPVCS